MKSTEIVLAYKDLFYCFSEQTEIMDTAKQLGWSDCVVSFSSGKKGASGTVNYAIRTDFQVKLELARILNGDDKLPGK